jgi:hypothetical protein
MCITLTQRSVGELKLEEWNGSVKTGAMTECASVIIFCKSGMNYGVHIGGGLSEEGVDEILGLLKAKEEIPSRIYIIFGVSRNEGSLIETNALSHLRAKYAGVFVYYYMNKQHVGKENSLPTDAKISEKMIVTFL